MKKSLAHSMYLYYLCAPAAVRCVASIGDQAEKLQGGDTADLFAYEEWRWSAMVKYDQKNRKINKKQGASNE